MSRSSKAGRGAIANSLCAATTLLVGFILTPMLLALLGEARLGAFQTLSAWFGYLSLIELGMGGALMRRLAKANTAGDTAVIGVLSVGRELFRTVALRQFCVGLAFSLVAAFVISAPQHLHYEIVIACLFLSIVRLFNVTVPYQLYFNALQLSWITGALLTAQAIAVPVVAVLAARSGWGVASQASGALVGGFVYSLGLWWIYKKKNCEKVIVGTPVDALNASPGELAGKDLRGIRKEGRRFLANRVSGQVSLLSDPIFISFFLGPAAVTPFLLTRRLPEAVFTQVSSIVGASWSGLAELYHRKEHRIFAQRFIDLNKLIVMFSCTLIVPVTLLTPHLMRLWVGESQFAGWGVSILVAVCSVLRLLASLWNWTLGGTGHVQATVGPNIAAAAANVSVSAAATYAIGISGPLLGTAISIFAVQSWMLAPKLKRYYGVSAGELVQAISIPAAIGSLFFFALRPWTNGLELGWTGVATIGLGVSFSIAATYWLIALNSADRRKWLRRFKATLWSGQGEQVVEFAKGRTR